MAVPLTTTTITITRPAVVGDPYDAAETTSTVASGVRAHISAPSGREAQRGGEQQTVDKILDADPVDLRHTDRVVDDGTGQTYEVAWVDQREGLGLDHTVAGLRRAGAAV